MKNETKRNIEEMSSADFIPLNSDKSKKRKHHEHKHRSGSEKDLDRSGSNKGLDRDPKSQVKNEARCPKLRARICKYLEENRHRVSFATF